ncbi:MAG: Rubrerythrin [Chitinivibrionales bacterium]|nr:Rubrerythrin [Chitinivibrionales bacterium]MBD3356731.1 Rubrerythrin [Chitinivibrionales bacterium]
MAEFVNPFVGMVPDRKLSNRELLRGLRQSLAAEQEAAHLYLALADATDNPLARRVLEDVADEERVHAGEFLRLIEILAKDEQSLLAQGTREVEEMREELRGKGAAAAKEEDMSEEEPRQDIPSIGNLRGER